MTKEQEDQLIDDPKPALSYAPLTNQDYKIIDALNRGPIRAIGGIVYGPLPGRALMNTSELHDVVRRLEARGICVRRTDSGGSPTWDYEP